MELPGPNVQIVASHAPQDRNTTLRPIRMTFAYTGNPRLGNKELASIRNLKNLKIRTTTKMSRMNI